MGMGGSEVGFAFYIFVWELHNTLPSVQASQA